MHMKRDLKKLPRKVQKISYGNLIYEKTFQEIKDDIISFISCDNKYLRILLTSFR